MAASSAGKFAFKPRHELDTMIDAFEQELARRLTELTDHFNAHADIILSMTGADDDQHVYGRINGILQRYGLLEDSPPPER